MSDDLGTIGPYTLLTRIGRGGMGVVYKARHGDSGDIVALKSVRIPDVDLLQCIRREIRALANVRHPGVIRIIEEGVDQGLPWYAMELVEGALFSRYTCDPSAIDETVSCEPVEDTRSQEIHSRSVEGADRTPSRWWTMPGMTGDTGVHDDFATKSVVNLPVEPSHRGKSDTIDTSAPGGRADIDQNALKRAISLVYRLCSPLAYLHGEGIIHRDLKPENILVRTNGWPVIVDFGLLTRYGGVSSRESLHIEHKASGSIRYMSPEQIRAALVDARSDLYSLGCILYELLSGQPPFSGTNTAEILRAHLMLAPIPLSSFLNGIPPSLDELVLRLLEKSPGNRIGYADDVARILADCGAVNGHDSTMPVAKHYLYRPEFVGRDIHFRMVVDSLDSLSVGKGNMILIGGESGIGKTRLVLEVGREAVRRNFAVYISESSSMAHTPLESLKKTLRELGDHCRVKGQEETDIVLGERGKILALYYPALKELPGQEHYSEPVELPAAEAQLRLFNALAETFAILAGRQPIVLIIDDLQWIDELTQSFLEYLLTSSVLRENPLFIIGAYRTEERSDGCRRLLMNKDIHSITLERLNREAVSDIVHNMLATAAPPAFSDYLTVQSEGNPFFVAEYLRAAVHEHILTRDRHGFWQVMSSEKEDGSPSDYRSLPLPGSLREVVGRRLQGLSAGAVTLVQIAAVIGRNFHESLLEKLSEFEERLFLDTVKELLGRQVIEETGPSALHFIHDKLREVAYDTIDPENLTNLHRKAAETIERLDGEIRTTYQISLGNHWEKAGIVEKAMQAYLLNANLAREQHSLLEAEEYYRHYFRLLPKPTVESISARRIFAVDVLWLRGDLEKARTELELALKEVDAEESPELELEILTSLGGVCFEMAEEEHCILYSETALNKAIAGNFRTREAWALINLCLVYNKHGQTAIALAACDRALELSGLSKDLPLQVRVLTNKFMILVENGQYERAESIGAVALELNGELKDSRNEAYILGHLAFLYRSTGRNRQAEATFRHVITIAQKIGEMKLESRILGNLALLISDRGNHREAIAMTQRAVELARKSGDIMFEQKWLGNLGIFSHYLGDLDRAIEYLKQTISPTERTGDTRLKSSVLGNLGVFHKERGQLEIALDYTNQALELSTILEDEPSQGLWYGNRGGIFQQLGLVDKATEDFRKSIALLENHDYHKNASVAYCNLAHHILLTTGDTAESERLCDHADESAQKTDDTFHNQMILICRGYIALARGLDAREYAQALELLEQDGKLNGENILGSSFSMLREAMAAAESGRSDLLHHGVLITHISPKFKATLGIT